MKNNTHHLSRRRGSWQSALALATILLSLATVGCGYSFSFAPQNCLVGEWTQPSDPSDPSGGYDLLISLNSDMTYALYLTEVSTTDPVSAGTYSVEYSKFTITKNNGEIRFIQSAKEYATNPGDHYVKFTWTGSQENGPETLKMVENGRYKMLVWAGDAE